MGENWINLPQKVKILINFPPCLTKFLFIIRPWNATINFSLKLSIHIFKWQTLTRKSIQNSHSKFFSKCCNIAFKTFGGLFEVKSENQSILTWDLFLSSRRFCRYLKTLKFVHYWPIWGRMSKIKIFHIPKTHKYFKNWEQQQ